MLNIYSNNCLKLLIKSVIDSVNFIYIILFILVIINLMELIDWIFHVQLI